jgi:3-hydroxyisobutyrate dehydrogenase
MANHLLNAGYPLVVWNRTESKMDELVAAGAKAGESPKDVAMRSEVVIIMVGDSPDVKEVVLGPTGIIEGAEPGLTVIDMSSISPIATQEISKALREKGVRMLDAPVSGGDIGAKEATLSIMVGGPEEVYLEMLPIFEVMGEQITHMGSSGAGQATKLCNQVICGMHIQAVCEGLMLGRALDLDLERLLQVLTAGYANSRILGHLGPKMVEGDLEPGFKMRHQQKDLKNALQTASELDLPLLAISVVQQMFRGVEAEDLGEKGTQAAIRVMEKLANREL